MVFCRRPKPLLACQSTVAFNSGIAMDRLKVSDLCKVTAHTRYKVVEKISQSGIGEAYPSKDTHPYSLVKQRRQHEKDYYIRA